jgi:hypothetical protein
MPAIQLTIQEEKVLEANQNFYTALENLSLDEMEAVWLQEPWVRCVHPGWNLLEGWESVRESWQQIFESTSFMRVVVGIQAIRAEETTAWVCCTEKVSTVGDNRIDSVYLQTTNIFERRNGVWYMVHHHGSPLPEPWPQDPGIDFVN